MPAAAKPSGRACRLLRPPRRSCTTSGWVLGGLRRVQPAVVLHGDCRAVIGLDRKPDVTHSGLLDLDRGPDDDKQQAAVLPPFTSMTCPAAKRAASEARNVMPSAMS